MSTPHGNDPNQGWSAPGQGSPPGQPGGTSDYPPPGQPQEAGFGQPDYSQVQPDYGQPYGQMPRSLAGFWIRFGAALIDGIIIGIVNLILALFLSDMLSQIVALLVSAGYFVYFHATQGQSLGQKAVSIKVIDEQTGELIDYGRAGIRWFVSQLATVATIIFGPLNPLTGIISIAILIGYLWMLWDANNQTWHDKAAKTVVVKVT